MPYVLARTPMGPGRVNYRRRPFLVRRGFGDAASDCASGNAAACKDYYANVYSKAASVVAAQQQQQAIDDSNPAPRDYPSAPGCHVVNLTANRCVLDNGVEVGCNSIIECDPITGAMHGQTVPLVNNPAFTPNLKLVNPSGPSTPSVLKPFALPPPAQSNAPRSKVVTLPTKSTSSNGASNQGTAVPAVSALTDLVSQAQAVVTGNWFDGISNWALLVGGGVGLFLLVRAFGGRG